MKRRVERLIKLIKDETGLDIFRNTRRREYVEARALFTYMLKTYFGCRLSDIQMIYSQNGYEIHHATLIHAIKNFEPVYIPFNKPLKEMYEKSINLFDTKADFKIRYIKNKVDQVPEEKLDEVKYLVDLLTI
jgi:hypothetical protein